VNLTDWINELCDVLEIDPEVDRDLVLDLARDAAHNVERPAAPITTYLLGYAAALHNAGPAKLEQLAGAASELAERFGGSDLAYEEVDDEPAEADPKVSPHD
jgi:hypothetical protein